MTGKMLLEEIKQDMKVKDLLDKEITHEEYLDVLKHIVSFKLLLNFSNRF